MTKDHYDYIRDSFELCGVGEGSMWSQYYEGRVNISDLLVVPFEPPMRGCRIRDSVQNVTLFKIPTLDQAEGVLCAIKETEMLFV